MWQRFEVENLFKHIYYSPNFEEFIKVYKIGRVKQLLFGEFFYLPNHFNYGPQISICTATTTS